MLRSKSSLFFVFVEILEHIKSLNPKVLFLQENVGSARKEDVGVMSRALGVPLLDSACNSSNTSFQFGIINNYNITIVSVEVMLSGVCSYKENFAMKSLGVDHWGI